MHMLQCNDNLFDNKRRSKLNSGQKFIESEGPQWNIQQWLDSTSIHVFRLRLSYKMNSISDSAILNISKKGSRDPDES